jgi:soluble lytic murein transglycosylase-like protein
LTKTSRKISNGSLGGLIAAALVWATPSQAAVIEIAADGEAVTYAAPAVFTAEGVRPIGASPSARAIPKTAGDVAAAIANASSRHAVSPHLIEAVAWRESRFRQNASSSAGAVGVMQLMAGTAKDLGVNRYDLDQNVSGGAAYLRAMLQRYGGDLTLALAAYNAGPGAVDRYGAVPPYRETQAYVAAILSRLSDRALLASPVSLAGR